MKAFGIQRAKLNGWANTYVFTKAMGETLLVGFKALGPLILQLVVILGKFKCILADPVSVLDLIPVDMVVNSIIVATVANANRSACVIYHVGTSMRNPVTISDFLNVVRKYFTRNPWLNKDREPVKIRRMKIFKSTATFSMYMQIRFVLPLAGLKLVSKAFGQYFRNGYVDYNRKMTSVMRLVGLYKPFMLFKGIFDDTNAEELRRATRESFIDAYNFDFDPKSIDWEDYFIQTHIPGLQKHVLIK
ncbi:hypothetical protein L3X38_031784 [Prunus dulcis]|uniref:Fatty acyl-CoA reductase C-terminal domain-containing protein n=1 Tax=Prunus dulcis TaxID=3755 RepID=A0AAD4VF22_PRUDU|nr:hypothetical protein L3X38_031784 [Prunus dulcis]